MIFQKLGSVFSTLSPFRSVRGRFSAVMGLTGVVFALTLTGLMEWRWESSIKAATYDTLHLTAHRIGSTLIESIDNRQMEIQVVADMIGSNHLQDAAAIGQLFDRMKERQPDHAWIGYAGVDGKVIAASDGLLQGVDVSQRPWFQNGLKSVFLGDPHLAQLLAGILGSSATGEPHRFLDVAVPIRNARQETLGVIGSHLYWDWVKSVSAIVLADLDKQTPIEVLIADQQGGWIMKPPNELSANLTELDAKADQSQYLTARAPVVFKTLVNGASWTVLVREEKRFAYAMIQDNRILIAGVSLIVMFMISGVAWIVSGRVVQPIIKLVDMARAHSQGRGLPSDVRHLSAKDETGVLGQVMHQMAFYDVLTGLANRRLLREHLVQAQQLAVTNHLQGALMLIDLDNFSLLNDTKGDPVGDQVLIEMAERLSSIAGSNDTVARLGNDEFVLLTTGLKEKDAHLVARQRAEEVLAAIQRPMELSGETHHYTASIGICLFGPENVKVAELLKQVEVAMLEAKKSAHTKIYFYNNEMQVALDERELLERSLRPAIPDQLRVLYQPQANDDGEIIGAELLVRWQHPTMGMVPPARFVPVAESTGMIVSIGQWVLEQACDRLSVWRNDDRLKHLILAVNVSAKEFIQPDFVDRVTQTVRASGIDPSKLKLELTESILANDIHEIVQRMNDLKSLGISFALDDFGTGFSSLAYLKLMPLDQLKIDQSFVKSVVSNVKDAAIVHAVIALGQSMQLEVIAEGVETQEQHTFLRAAGCLNYQGYFFGRPMPVDELESKFSGKLGLN